MLLRFLRVTHEQRASAPVSDAHDERIVVSPESRVERGARCEDPRVGAAERLFARAKGLGPADPYASPDEVGNHACVEWTGPLCPTLSGVPKLADLHLPKRGGETDEVVGMRVRQ